MSSSAEGQPARSWLRRQLGTIVKVVVSAALIAYLFLTIDMKAALTAILHANAWWLLAGFAACLFTFYLRALRWRALIQGWGARIPMRKLVLWYLVGSLFNSVLPTGFGGDVLRVYELNRQVHDPVMAANSVIVDRYLGIVILLGMGLAAVPLGAAHVETQVVLILAGLFVLSLAAGALLLNQRGWRRFGERLPLVGGFLSGKLAGLEGTARYYSRRSLIESTAWSLVFNVVLIAWTVFLALGVGIHLPLRYFVVFTPLTSIALMLPSVGGLGVREMSYAALFPAVGVAAPLAVSVSLLLYLTALAAGLLGGVLYMLSGAGSLLRAGSKS